MIIDVKPVQLRKELLPNDVTPSGMVIVDKPLQPKNASFPMEVMFTGMIVLAHPIIKELLLVSIIALQLSRESYLSLPVSALTEFRLGQSLKAELPILVTHLGIVMEVILEQPWYLYLIITQYLTH